MNLLGNSKLLVTALRGNYGFFESADKCGV